MVHMHITFRQLGIRLWLGAPVLGALACSEDNESPTTGPDMATAAAGTSRIAFIVDRPDGETEMSDVYTIIPDGTGLRRLTSGQSYDNVNWAPGGANAKIAAEGGGDIYALNPDGTGGTNLTNTPNTGENEPVWSPDGSKIVYIRESDVWVMNANGSGQRNLTRSSAGDGSPRWSPDSRKILFLSVGGVYVMNADGSGRRRLSTNSTAQGDSDPAWSPDGRLIAFQRGHEIYVMNSDGSGQKNVSNHPAGDGFPLWSPNSTKIAFSTNRKGNPEVYLMGRWGGGKINLTQTPTNEEVARGWSPGGARILFVTGREIWVMDADGSNRKRVTIGRDPVWSR
jgi:dipeptidyl aminopeptidase/acylaminoacyl peptidase